MTLTILEGSTFCICDERGDIGQETSGFFVEDTRYLSRFALTRPPHVNVDELVVKALAQSSAARILRTDD